MLQTTVAYLSMLESRRHNMKSEEQLDADIAIRKQEANTHAGQLAETQRHNKETESQGWASILETSRHNQATEGIQVFDAQTRRLQNDINWYNAQTNRYSAEQQAGIGWANVSVNEFQADTARYRASNDYDIALKNYGVSQQRAETDRMNAETRQDELAWKRTYESDLLSVQHQNADSASKTAETNAFNASVNAWNAQTNEARQKTDQALGISREIREWFTTMPKSNQTSVWKTILQLTN